ncbi:chemotaxis protein CheD [Curvibacter sp. RS43]|uniref:chemotaxis protein CheD n=1 Tax=Curvibacter microcysteis TaxID=3026419 RepID=UPI002362BE5B|nr:chemotaxis protein CheD [Curvibacter sp. RS43]MDD0809896.1 chemotaxis protein CheD [Curvibacter sp. RS43]
MSRPFEFLPSQPLEPRVRFLHPGDVALAQRGERLDTLLGSCVAVLLTDPKRTVGAMCHIVHTSQRAPQDPHDTRHGQAAMRTLFAQLRAVGFAPEHCEAWVCGGGNMFPERANAYAVGDANLDWVNDFLARAGIPVLAESVGGPFYRRIAWTIGDAEPIIEEIPVEDLSH